MIFLLWDPAGGNSWNGTKLVVIRLPTILGQKRFLLNFLYSHQNLQGVMLC